MARLKDSFIPDDSNRVAEAIFLNTEEEAKLRINNPLVRAGDTYDLKLKLAQYRGIVKEFRRSKNQSEKKALNYVRHEIRKVKAKLNPTIFNQFFYSNGAERFKRWLRGKNDPVSSYHNAAEKLGKELVQQHNLQNLSAELKKAGFSSEMEASLKRMINLNLPQFHLRYADIENPNAHYVVHFKKIPQSDLYYFEKFDAIARPSLDSLLNRDPHCCRQTFTVNNELKINAKEAANLVNGKSVCRHIDGDDRWLILNALTSRLTEVPFNLEDQLSRIPIKERDDPNKYQAIVEALKRGNRKEVTLIINDKPVKHTIEAAPFQNTIYTIDKNNRLVDIDLALTKQQATQVMMEKVYDVDQSQYQHQGRTIR